MEDSRFCQVICKYISAIASQEIEVLVAYKALRLLISKVNIETLKKFNTVSIARCQCHCAPLLTSILRTCMRMENVDDNQELHSDDKEDRLELGNTPSQEIPEDQKVNRGKNRILIATIALCMLFFAKN